jgi:hypothetical protein
MQDVYTEPDAISIRFDTDTVLSVCTRVLVCISERGLHNLINTNTVAFSRQANYRLSDRHLLAKFSANFCG